MRNPDICGIKTGCAETIWSTDTPSLEFFFSAPVFVSNRFSLLLFARGDDGLGRIGRPHKGGAYFGIQAIVLVGSLILLTERECGRSDDIIDNAHS